jgi:hypothetical protein
MAVPGLDPIGAKISESFSDSFVVGAVRGDVFAAQAHYIASCRLSAEGELLGEAWRQAGAANARHRGGSGGKFPVGRVLEFVYERLEQQDHQKMRQYIRLG